MWVVIWRPRAVPCRCRVAVRALRARRDLRKAGWAAPLLRVDGLRVCLPSSRRFGQSWRASSPNDGGRALSPISAGFSAYARGGCTMCSCRRAGRAICRRCGLTSPAARALERKPCEGVMVLHMGPVRRRAHPQTWVCPAPLAEPLPVAGQISSGAGRQ